MRDDDRREAERIKGALDDPRGLCEALGMLDGRRGHDWQPQPGGAVLVLCPWHSERSPSCSVTRAADGGIRVKCFGCSVTGDALSLVAVRHGYDVRREFHDVLDAAARHACIAPPERMERPQGARISEVRPIVRKPAAVAQDAPEDGSVDAVARALADLAPVTGDRAAMGYLHARGLASSRVALGWYALPSGEPERERLRDEVVERVGFDLWSSSGLCSIEGPRLGLWSYAWTGPRLVIPWRAPNGTAESLQGRFLGTVPGDVRKYTFPRGRRPRWPFGVEGLDDAGPDAAVAVVEGAIDAVSFNLLARSAGADVVALAVPGVSAWDARWLRLFARRRCIVGLDADRAGEAAVAEMSARLRAVAMRDALRKPRVEVARPLTGKDWNEALCAEVA